MTQKFGGKVRELLVKEAAKAFASEHGFIFSTFDKVKVSEMDGFRRKLRGMAGVKYLLVKKTLARKALKDAGLEELASVFETRKNVGVMTVPKDAAAAAKLLREFSKSNANFAVSSGYIDRQVLGADKIRMLAELPSRGELLTMTVRTLNAPAANFVYVFAAMLRKLCYALNAVKDNKGKG